MEGAILEFLNSFDHGVPWAAKIRRKFIIANQWSRCYESACRAWLLK
jgi:hypothetical protein